jgi:hypothetical protein
MEFELKKLSSKGVKSALERARHYRLLNEPEQAESICRDIIATDPGNQEAVATLLLALTDQFRTDLAHAHPRAREALAHLSDEYQRRYYDGLINERRGRAQLARAAPGSQYAAYECLRSAMALYEAADALATPGNEEARLRWNACARTIMEKRLEPAPDDSFRPLLE